jgi:hypothetical protein
MGNSVLIGDQWYYEGQSVLGFEITKIGPDYVTVLRDGKEQRLAPFDVQVNYGQASRGSSGTPGGREGREAERGMRGGRGAEGGMPQQRGGMGGGMPGGGMPGGMGNNMGMGNTVMELRNRIESMTPEQRQETFDRFRNASPRPRSYERRIHERREYRL